MKRTSKTVPNSGAKPRIVFFGNERIATGVNTTCPTLTKLLEAGYEVAAVVVNHDQKASRKQRKLEIADVAARFEVPVLSPASPSDIIDELRSYQADIGVLVAYGRIVPQQLIDVFLAGIVNIHPSLLPLHRGSTPIESVILSGEEKTGVSLMSLTKEMDAGAVYAYSEIELEQQETKQQLADDLLELGSEMLLSILPRIASGAIAGSPQNDSRATYDSMIVKQDGVLDLSKPAEQLEREVRAYLGWPGSHMVIAGKDVVVTRVHMANNTLANVDKKTIFVANKQLCLQTADGVLVIDSLKPAGKSDMPASAFLAGYGRLL